MIRRSLSVLLAPKSVRRRFWGGRKYSDDNPKDLSKDKFFTQDKAFGSKENKGQGDKERPVFSPEEEKEEEPESVDPSTCCGSGCANCVWIEYVEKLSKRFSDPSLGRERILKELEAVHDDNIKAYIMMELRIKKLI